MSNIKGFSLIECLVTIVFIAILATMGVTYARQNIKEVAMNEGRMLIEHIVEREKDYFNRHYAFLLTTGEDPVSKIEEVDEIIDISLIGQYFKKFKITKKGEKITIVQVVGSNSRHNINMKELSLCVELYPDTANYPNLKGVSIRGTYDAGGNEIVYDEIYDDGKLINGEYVIGESDK